jgi:hypothetical protein
MAHAMKDELWNTPCVRAHKPSASPRLSELPSVRKAKVCGAHFEYSKVFQTVPVSAQACKRKLLFEDLNKVPYILLSYFQMCLFNM